jgi:hypothetical protein
LARLAGKRPSLPHVHSKPISAKSELLRKQQADYHQRLKLNRNYEELMRSDTYFPLQQVQGTDLFARDEEEERQKELVKERVRKGNKETVKRNKREVGAEEPWCARCNRKHAVDFHKSKSIHSRPALSRPAVDNYSDSASDLDDFIVPDGPTSSKKLLRRREEEEEDSDMEAGLDEIMEEEQRSARIGQREDIAELSRSKRLI